MESIIKDYLLANPDILREMGQLLEQQERLAEDQQRKGALVANADKYSVTGRISWPAIPTGTVTMVEFFDYNCGWCKRAFRSHGVDRGPTRT
jgi:protein-disulfide isomerase